MRKSTLVIIAAAVALAGCTSKESATSAGGGQAGGTVIMVTPGDAVEVFPPFVNDQVGRWVQDLVFERLADLKPGLVTKGDQGFAPRLAQKWTWAPDSLSIAFSLDPRARWHDGTPVTAQDVKYSLDIFKNPKVGSPVTPNITNIDSISVRDSLTAVAWFHKRKPEQFYDLAYQLMVMPKHVYDSIPPEQLHTSPTTRKLVGSGPFRFVSWQPGSRIEFIADTANYRGRPSLDRVIMTPGDPATGAAQLLAGQVDLVIAFPVDQVPKLDSSTVARSMIDPQLAYVFMAMNPHVAKSKTEPNPVFADIRVRRALSMAVDRVGMLHNVFGNDGILSHGPFPMAAGYADSTLRLPPFDTTAAKALLDSAGWRAGADGMRSKNGKPLRFSLMLPSSSLFRRRYGVLMQEQFRKVGAQVDLDVVDNPTMIRRLLDHDWDAELHAPGVDPSLTGEEQFWATRAIGANGQNFIPYSNPKVDALLDSAIATFDPAKSKGQSSRAFQMMIDDAPGIWLYDVTVYDGINRRITVPTPTISDWWMNLQNWSIPADKRIPRDRIGLAPAKP
ncbi:MAG TPA: peptide ABC transporter substrate-binding protein [Gemmatimonadaceae bacterium]|jgi:peptide/nickel transport system substrate-binding protein